ncbi:hypothetical protein BDFB_011703 [Asbolus verrucosus]|uniref:CRAL-TRIO domain-containing protein n=1 Tax=Asbolus verrucosus TaxID=1661398 RepID=A0A482WBK4_ASBVE|nr:hypothetical protein BDFB_011703 [Asbolus verrucosus]
MTVTLWEISDDVEEAIPKVFNTTRKTLDEDVKMLQRWMETQPHLPEIMDANSVRNFLVLNKCSIERTKVNIDLYYTARSKIPEFFENVNPKSTHMRKMMDTVYLITLPKLTKNMSRVTVFKVRDSALMGEFDHSSYHSNVIRLVENLKTLQELVGKEILPVDYGGEEKSLEELNNLMKLKYLEYEEWFDRQEARRVDESLRPAKLQNDDIFGFYGNFKKLDVD